MKILNYGSLCIDHVYSVPYFVKPGETLSCTNYERHPGGKGLNQSLALANAGADVWHAGLVGNDGIWLKELLAEAGVGTAMIRETDTPTGHALIQVNPVGENCIVICGGANKTVKIDDLDQVFAQCAEGDCLLLQNEISSMPEIMTTAKSKSMQIAFNAAPITNDVLDYPLECVDLFILNEVEAEALSGEQTPERMIKSLINSYPHACVVLTLGEQGATYGDPERIVHQDAFTVKVLDTTGAGDTFTGFFLAGWLDGQTIEQCLEVACKAAAICVTRKGAATSIPSETDIKEVYSNL
jgi:ribokinase